MPYLLFWELDTNLLRSSSYNTIDLQGKRSNGKEDDENDSNSTVSRALLRQIPKTDGSIVKFYRDVDTDGASRYKIDGRSSNFQNILKLLEQRKHFS